jgi:serine protease Do
MLFAVSLLTGSLFLLDGASVAAQETKTDAFETMMLTSKAFRAAVEKVRPSLVTIESYGGVSAVQGRIGGIRKQGEGNTTGVIISSDGYIVTSTFNFIQRPPVITVITSDGQRRTAQLKGRDDIRKICLLKIDDVDDLPVPQMIDAKELSVGQWAISVGVGYGDMSPAVSTGIISAKNRIGGRAIQTDANISPANYGGPLLDIEGRMIGLCVPMNPQSQAVGAGVEWYDSGIGFAIPIDADSRVIERLKEDGVRITPPYLGLKLMPVKGRKGLWVEKVVPDSPADQAGIQREDFIRGIDGEEVADMLKLRQILNRFEAEDKIKLTVWFEETKEVEDVDVVVGTPPQPTLEGPTLEPPEIK